MVNFYDFIKADKVFLKLSVNDLMMVEYNCPITENIQTVWSKYNYIAYVCSGEKTWCDQHQELRVRPGQAILVRKGVTRVIQDFSADFCVILIFFPDNYALQYEMNPAGQTAPQEIGFDKQNLCLIEPDHLLESYFNSIAFMLAAPEKPAEKLIHLKFMELLLLLSQYKQFGQAWSLINFWSREKRMRPLMEQLVFESMQLEDYANTFNMSVSTFKRKFSAEFGTTPMKWIRDQRILRAGHLLLSSDKTIQEILYETGFTDPSHFNKTFRQFYNVSPADYRKSK